MHVIGCSDTRCANFVCDTRNKPGFILDAQDARLAGLGRGDLDPTVPDALDIVRSVFVASHACFDPGSWEFR